MNKKILIPTLGLITLFGVGTLGASAIKADETPSYSSIVQKIAQKFNLKEDEVKTVFDEAHQERLNMMQQNREERLNKAVSDGVITEIQKEALLSRWQEMQTEREQRREGLQTWLKEQGINPDVFRQYGGFGSRGGFGGRWMWDK